MVTKLDAEKQIYRCHDMKLLLLLQNDYDLCCQLQTLWINLFAKWLDNNAIFHKLTKNRFPKLSRYFQHSVIWDANNMLKQGVYQLPLSCLCIQEKTYINSKRWFAVTWMSRVFTCVFGPFLWLLKYKSCAIAKSYFARSFSIWDFSKKRRCLPTYEYESISWF
jgi:hypothetical protein